MQTDRPLRSIQSNLWTVLEVVDRPTMRPDEDWVVFVIGELELTSQNTMMDEGNSGVIADDAQSTSCGRPGS